MIEVELKAWVDDPAAVRARLDARYPLIGTFRKEDTYYRMPPELGTEAPRGAETPHLRSAAPRSAPPREFRIRIEGSVATVTSKEKHIEAGIEVNRENEFTVSDPAAFERFAVYVGARLFVRKVKVGRLYDALGTVAPAGASGGAAPGDARAAARSRARDGYRSLHIELSDVERLGTFIEIEALLEEPDERAIARARGEIREVLAAAGVDPARIEPRYYIDMLAALDGPAGGAQADG